MLTIRAMTGGAGYAQRHLEHSDYFDQNRTVQGEWHGRGAELLGLNGTVTHMQFEAIREGRHHETDDQGGPSSHHVDAAEGNNPTTRLLHPGEGGYDEALAEWDLQQNPDRAPVISTASGRDEAMSLVRAVATSPDHAVAPAIEALEDPEASGEALRHVLVGGTHSVEAFSAEIADAEGGEPLTAHETTKIIGEVLAELDE